MKCSFHKSLYNRMGSKRQFSIINYKERGKGTPRCIECTITDLFLIKHACKKFKNVTASSPQIINLSFCTETSQFFDVHLVLWFRGSLPRSRYVLCVRPSLFCVKSPPSLQHKRDKCSCRGWGMPDTGWHSNVLLLWINMGSSNIMCWRMGNQDCVGQLGTTRSPEALSLWIFCKHNGTRLNGGKA